MLLYTLYKTIECYLSRIRDKGYDSSVDIMIYGIKHLRHEIFAELLAFKIDIAVGTS